MTKTSVLNTQFIADQANLSCNTTFKLLNASEIIYLHDFKHKKHHQQNMCIDTKKISPSYKAVLEKKGVDYMVSFQFGSAEFKPSLGGLHSKRLKLNKTGTDTRSYNNLAYFGDQIKLFIEDDEFMALRLDFQSYYVALLLLLHKKLDPNSEVAGLLEAFNKNRLIAKADRNPVDSIYKVLTLAYSGNLNYAKSRVYNPQLYYSMTANGQLFLLELLEDLSHFIYDLLLLNTDGVVIVIQKKDYDSCLACCDNFENKHQLKIDTREKIKGGLFFGSNKNILKIKDKNVCEVKGFKKVFGFQYVPNTLETWLKKVVQSKKLLKDKNQLYDSFFDSFLEVKNNNFSLSKWVDIERNEKGQFLYYLPKEKPTHSMGFPKKFGQSFILSLAPFSTKLEYFQEGYLTLKQIESNLDFSQYWHSFCQSCFKGSFLTYTNVCLKEKAQHGLLVSEAFDYTNQTLLSLKRQTFLYKKLNEFASLGLYPYFKYRNKKSFSNVKKLGLEKSGSLYKETDLKQDYGEFMVKLFPTYFIMSAALTVDLEFTWETCFILCLDCDHVNQLFYLTKENLYILKFLFKAKESGSVLFSSPTNTPFDRFKVFVQVEACNKTYTEMQQLFKHSFLSTVFSLELKASLFGDNKDGLSIVQCDDFKPYKMCLDELLVKHVEQNVENVESQMKDLLCDFFYERSHHERLHYNTVPLKDKNVFDWDKSNFPMDFFLEVFYKVVFKHNLNRIHKENCLSFYGFQCDGSLKKEQKQQLKQAKKDVEKQKKTTTKSTSYFENKQIEVTSSQVKIVTQLTENKVSVLDLNKPEVKFMYDLLMEYINSVYETSFVYTESIQVDGNWTTTILIAFSILYPKIKNK